MAAGGVLMGAELAALDVSHETKTALTQVLELMENMPQSNRGTALLSLAGLLPVPWTAG